MLALFRNFAKSWLAKILFVILIVSFGLFFGINDVIRGRVSNAVITAGGREVGPQEFKQVFENQKHQIEQQQNAGQPIPIGELYDAGVPQKVAQQYATQVAFDVWLGRVGLRPSDKLVGEQLKTLPVFFNPVTGAFDKDRYLGQLAQNGLTPQRFETELADQIATEHLGAGFSAGMHLPRIYGAFLSTLVLETRDASWISVDEKMVGAPGRPSDAQLQTFIRLNAARYRRPDLRAGEMVLFSPEAVAKTLKVSDDEIKQAYARANLSAPETRSFVQIAAPAGAGQAQAMANAIRSGAPADRVAAANKLAAAAFSDKVQNTIPYPKIAAAVFAMNSGEVQAVQGELGWAVVQLTGVTPAHSTPIEKVRAQLDQSIRQEKAKAEVDDLAQKYQDARDKGASMAKAASDLGLPMVSVPQISEKGASPEGQPVTVAGQPLQPDMIKAIFATAKGGDSEVTQGQNGNFFAVHVDNVVPAAMPALDAIRDQVTHDWMVQEMQRLLTAKADALAARIRAGEGIDRVAASVGAKVETQNDFRRPAPPQNQEQLQALIAQHPEVLLLNAAFAHGPGDVFEQPLRTTIAVARINGVHTPPPAVAAAVVESVRPRMSVQQAQDLFTTARDQARVRLKAKVNSPRIAEALGISPDAKAKQK